MNTKSRIQKYKSRLFLMSLGFVKSEIEETEDIEPFPSPLPGPQTNFIDSEADIVIFGGAAGGGKTLGCLLDAVKYVDIEGYSAMILRRSYPEIADVGGMLDVSRELYPKIGGKLITTRLTWTFPVGSKVRFGHIQYDSDLYRKQGAQYPRLYFDELTTFSENQFWYLLSRCRTTLPITPQVRCTCNPDASSWVRVLLDSGGYIDDLGFPKNGGVLRYFVRIAGELVWADSVKELAEKHPGIPPKSFTFIPSNIEDNPILLEKDPAYLANLYAQHPVDRDRLLFGNWNATYEEGTVFQPEWFVATQDIPPGLTIRFWDLAGTAKSSAFYTAGVLMRKTVSNQFYVIDVRFVQFDPLMVLRLIAQTAIEDGEGVAVYWEQEPGSSGKVANESIKKAIAELAIPSKLKIRCAGISPRGDKVTRAIPYAVAASQGLVRLQQADWNATYINSLQKFDGTPKTLVNDLTDASSGAFAVFKSANVSIGNYSY